MKLLTCMIMSVTTVAINAQTDPVEVGTLPGIISESSGLQLDPTGIVWTFNDDDSGRIHAIQQSGAYAGQLILDGADQIDYEDIAIDPAGTLYVGDFGNNENDRDDLRIYVLPEPASSLHGAVEPLTIDFTLSDQTGFPPDDSDLNYDIEAMIHFAGQLHLFSRNRTDPFNGITKWYTLEDEAGEHIAQFQSTYVGNLSQTFSSITAADMSPSGDRLVLLSRGAIHLFTDPDENDLFSGGVDYNFFTFTANLEGITFLDDCQLLISEEASGNDNARLFQLNSCDIVSGLHEENRPPLTIHRENGRLRLELPDKVSDPLLTIHDSQGRLVHHQKDWPYIDILNWSEGVYLITLTIDDQSFSSHWIK